MNADSDLEARLKAIMQEHYGEANPIGMGDLYARLFFEVPEHKINGTDKLRGLIRRLRERGDLPICSTSNRFHPGYYLAETPEELKAFFDRLRSRALSSLNQIAHMERHALAVMEGQGEVISDQ